jgi:tRNA uridine 5-carbamoylmethylation protein Kti12
MPKLIMLVGVPGSGKTTFVKSMIEDEMFPVGRAIVVSTDDFIENHAKQEGKTYNEVFDEAIGPAGKHLDSLVKYAIENNLSVIWDQTNLNRSTRAKKLARFPKNYETMAIYFPAPEDLEERLASRPGKTIPENVLNNMIKNCDPPRCDEGFHNVMWNLFGERLLLVEKSDGSTYRTV